MLAIGGWIVAVSGMALVRSGHIYGA